MIPSPQNPRIDREQLDEIVDILLETVCTSRKSIRVAGDDYPAELVKAKFLKLDSHHIEFVMDCLRDNTTKVRNIKQYLRAMLFNAPSTINSYYASLVALMHGYRCHVCPAALDEGDAGPVQMLRRSRRPHP